MANHNFKLIVLALGLSTLACTTTTPVSEIPEEAKPFELVISDIEAHIGDPIRWGGLIQGVINTEAHTIVEILETPITDKGRPYPNKESKGRFKAQIDGFVDPANFAKGDMMTVVGTVLGNAEGKIGEYTYTYPLIEVERSQQWDRASYELNQMRRKMNIGFGWSNGHRGIGVGWGMPFHCDMYGDCDHFW